MMPLRFFGGVFLIFGGIALALEEPFSIGRFLAVFFVSYILWGMSFSTVISTSRIVKSRGWLFPSFKSEYSHLKKIELKSSYIYQHGHGAHSHDALYVGIINGASNEFVDLSWGVRKTEDGEGYREFVDNLQALTNLPVNVGQDFKAKFKEKYNVAFLCRDNEGRLEHDEITMPL